MVSLPPLIVQPPRGVDTLQCNQPANPLTGIWVISFALTNHASVTSLVQTALHISPVCLQLPSWWSTAASKGTSTSPLSRKCQMFPCECCVVLCCIPSSLIQSGACPHCLPSRSLLSSFWMLTKPMVGKWHLCVVWICILATCPFNLEPNHFLPLTSPPTSTDIFLLPRSLLLTVVLSNPL